MMLSPKNPFPNRKALKGSQGAGIRFQDRIGAILETEIRAKRLEGRLYSDLWLFYEDANGQGYAQPDHFILQPERIILLECKLTQVDTAWDQMDGLYVPLLRKLFRREEIIRVQAFKTMRKEDPTRPRISPTKRPLEFEDGAVWHQYS